jgi:hypothetical protein
VEYQRALHNNSNICKYNIFVNNKMVHYAISWKVAGLFPDEIMGFFNQPNLSSHTMVLGSTQPLTEMSTRNLPGDKG